MFIIKIHYLEMQLQHKETKAIGRLSGEILGRGFEGILQSGDSPLISEERRSFQRPTHAMDGNDVIGILDQITAYLPTEEATTSALLEDSLIELSDPIVDFITKAPYQSERADEWTQRVLASIESISKENLRAYFLEYLDDETAAHAGVVRVQLQVNATIGEVSRLLRTAFPTKSIITSFRIFYPSPWLHTSLQQNPEN
ncbi:unnamed protein product, partial [Mesorhabditis belari]|uniref:Uncharacterized protein n=1 Tax=Mesorhabditis belari TaxID=2138241 RepID=A0AAF3FF15_9BILA